MKSSSIVATGLVAMALTIAAAGIYIAEIDDAPGGALFGILIALCMIAFAVKTATSKSDHC